MHDRHPAPAIARLVEIMARLRDPQHGCPWDLAQDFRSIAPYTIEEAYEVADAIEHGDMPQLRDELGDLLLQVVFHARMAEEQGSFDFAAVAAGIADKMIRRHPHVFAEASVTSAGDQPLAWEEQKAQERARRAVAEGRPVSALDGVATGLPALTRALKLQARAARVGFDWPDAAPVYDKVAEEIDELRQAETTAQVAEELGDLLFAVANLSRHLSVDPESALRAANRKFQDRFQRLERLAESRGIDLARATPASLDALWNEVKAAGRKD